MFSTFFVASMVDDKNKGNAFGFTQKMNILGIVPFFFPNSLLQQKKLSGSNFLSRSHISKDFTSTLGNQFGLKFLLNQKNDKFYASLMG
jgi:hypothetical protein